VYLCSDRGVIPRQAENAFDQFRKIRAEIQVLDEAWNVVETIGNEDERPLV
jgi:hypothetical protein